MEIFASVLLSIYEMMTIPMSIYGFTVTLWGVMVFTLVGGVVFGLVGRLINGE